MDFYPLKQRKILLDSSGNFLFFCLFLIFAESSAYFYRFFPKLQVYRFPDPQYSCCRIRKRLHCT